MGKEITSAVLVIAFAIFVSSPLFAADETFVVGGDVGWDAVVDRSGIVEVAGYTARRALSLSSARGLDDPALDMAISFDAKEPSSFADAMGHYNVVTSPSVSVVGPSRARAGSGAAFFSGHSGLTLSGTLEGGMAIAPKRGALLSAGSRLSNFSIEFWLYPANTENGEQIFSWTATRLTASGESSFQRIRCLMVRNKLEWTFTDFFSSVDAAQHLTLTVSAHDSILPREWSHHLIRFDSRTGLLEYVVNGALEGTAYATLSGREGGEVFTPVVGSGGTLFLGPRYAGFMDEFRLYGDVLKQPRLSRFSREGGRAQTRFLDLGSTNTEILRIDASYSIDGAKGKSLVSENGAELRFFARAGESPYGWSDDEDTWLPISPGSPLDGRLRGRWIQLAAVLYPSGDGEFAPYLEELRVVYAPDEAPSPPSFVDAVAKDGAVELHWRASPDADLAGYLIYYGTRRGEYWGEEAASGASPIDVGNRTSFVVDGLRNGTLYYFAIAAYDRVSPRHIGEFSREVFSRPARTVR